LALGGDELPAQYLANWILGKPNNPPNTSYESVAHDTTIELEDAMQYLTAVESPEELKRRRYSTPLPLKKYQQEGRFGGTTINLNSASLLHQNGLLCLSTPSLWKEV
jgi:hypothetical protein